MVKSLNDFGQADFQPEYKTKETPWDMNDFEKVQQMRIKGLENEVKELKKDRFALMRVNTMAGQIILDQVETLRTRLKELEEERNAAYNRGFHDAQPEGDDKA